MQPTVYQDFNMTGQRLEVVREELKVNKSELARRIGSPQSHISKVLNGKESIGKHLSEQIVKQLRLNPIWWETGQGEVFLPESSEAFAYKDRKSRRLIELRQALNLSSEEMAEKLGMSLMEYEEAEAGKMPFSNQFTALIMYAFNITRLWWEHGENNMFQPTGDVELEEVDPDDFEVVYLPVAPVDVEGTFGEMSDPEANYGRFKRLRVTVPKGTNTERNVLFRIRGNSMYPVYPEGTLVRCKKVPRGDWEYLSPDVYAVSYGNSFVIKRVKDNELISRGYLTLHSDNPLAPGSITVPIDQIHHIWRKISINYSEPD